MDIRQEIKSANKVLGDFLKAGDAKGMASCYSTKPKLMAPNFKAFKGKKAITGFWQEILVMGVKSVSLRTADVEKLGRTAIETGVATLKGPKGKTIDNLDYVVVWKKEGKTWKLHWDIFNSNSPA
jgi:ketosteroid isomerase-like protein